MLKGKCVILKTVWVQSIEIKLILPSHPTHPRCSWEPEKKLKYVLILLHTCTHSHTGTSIHSVGSDSELVCSGLRVSLCFVLSMVLSNIKHLWLLEEGHTLACICNHAHKHTFMCTQLHTCMHMHTYVQKCACLLSTLVPIVHFCGPGCAVPPPDQAKCECSAAEEHNIYRPIQNPQ